MKKWAWIGLVLLGMSFSAFAQNPAAVVTGSTASAEKSSDLRMQTFDLVWRTVKDKHFDPTFGGVNWDEVRQRYEPRARTAATDADLYRILQEMLGELRQSHFNLIPPEAVIPDEEKETGGAIGIDLRIIDGKAVLSRVGPDSPAYRAGLRPGFLIESVGQGAEAKSIAQFAKPLAQSKESEALKTIRLQRRILGDINGEPGTNATLTFLDEKEKAHQVTILREPMKGELSPRLGNFPPQYTEFETKLLETNIAYIRFNIFTTPVIEKAVRAIRDHHEAAGMIFDLRGNPGGVGGIAMSIAGRLIEKGASLGTMKMRSGEMRFAAFPQANAFGGPVIVLIDSMSASTSEIFAAGLQEMGRAVVIGERSAGACLPSYFQKLPTGGMFQFAIADYKTPKGVLIEGRGVAPDIELKWNRASLLAGHDAQLDRALAELRRLQPRFRAVQ
jgi:carboxyl-terminal processing protease